jgi:hypothetical protein
MLNLYLIIKRQNFSPTNFSLVRLFRNEFGVWVRNQFIDTEFASRFASSRLVHESVVFPSLCYIHSASQLLIKQLYTAKKESGTKYMVIPWSKDRPVSCGDADVTTRCIACMYVCVATVWVALHAIRWHHRLVPLGLLMVRAQQFWDQSKWPRHLCGCWWWWRYIRRQLRNAW